jgi:hypothetical protein
MSEALKKIDPTQLMTLYAIADKESNYTSKKELLQEIERRQNTLRKQLNFQKNQMEEQIKIYDMFNTVTKLEQVQPKLAEPPKQVPLMNLDVPKPVEKVAKKQNVINHQKHILLDLPAPDKWLKDYKITQMGQPLNNMCKYDLVLDSIPESDRKMIDNNSGSFELYVNNGIDQVILVVVQRGIGRYIGTKNVKK